MNTTSKLPSYNTFTRSGRLIRTLIRARDAKAWCLGSYGTTAQRGGTLGAAESSMIREGTLCCLHMYGFVPCSGNFLRRARLSQLMSRKMRLPPAQLSLRSNDEHYSTYDTRSFVRKSRVCTLMDRYLTRAYS